MGQDFFSCMYVMDLKRAVEPDKIRVLAAECLESVRFLTTKIYIDQLRSLHGRLGGLPLERILNAPILSGVFEQFHGLTCERGPSRKNNGSPTI